MQRKFFFRNGNLTLALAGWWRLLWARSGCGGSGRAPGWCGWAVLSLLSSFSCIWLKWSQRQRSCSTAKPYFDLKIPDVIVWVIFGLACALGDDDAF
jgi:hypothetical protein